MAQNIEYALSAESGFSKDQNWLPCFAHVLNLVARCILDNGLQYDAPENNNDLEYEERTAFEPNDTNNILSKLRKGITKIRSVNLLLS